VSWGVGSTSDLCVKAPLPKLSPVQNSGGTVNACDGSISVDFLSCLATHPLALGQPLSAGTVVWVHSIYKDPRAPKTTNRSDAIQFTLLP
jgi:hypothetical protein